MNWRNYVVKLNVKSKVVDFNYPLNNYKTQTSSGTGFFISKKTILTCFHVVSGAINIIVVFNQTNILNGKIKNILPNDDLAIVELDNEVKDALILDHEIIKNIYFGDVFTVGFPLSSTNIKITKGIISGYQESLIQIDAALNHGNSGGPLVIFDATNNKYKVIGINVSKLKGDSEKTGFVVPIYRYYILANKNKIGGEIVVNKPCLYFDYQKLTQEKYKQNLFNNKYNLYEKIGVRITSLNTKYYYSKYINIDDIILYVNNSPVDYNGNVKFDFYPEKISLDDLGLWFVEDDLICFKIFNSSNFSVIDKSFKLKITNTNLLPYYYLDTKPTYFIENNKLILSIITEKHLENLSLLKINVPQLVKILERRLYHRDLFTVYLADINYNKEMTEIIEWPIGEIICEINDKKFNTFEEFTEITQNVIYKIKTIENKVFHL